VTAQELIIYTSAGESSSAGEYPVCLQAIAEGRADLTGLWQSFPLAEGAQVFDRLVHRDESLTKAVLIP
jgi:threonine dehydrogenase-like Zn-dependent dehydrogenase